MDTARTPEEKKYLAEFRRPVAQQFWESADIPRVLESDSWEEDGRFWFRTVYWEADEGPSRKGSFSLEFEDDSTEIIDWWVQ